MIEPSSDDTADERTRWYEVALRAGESLQYTVQSIDRIAALLERAVDLMDPAVRAKIENDYVNKRIQEILAVRPPTAMSEIQRLRYALARIECCPDDSTVLRSIARDALRLKEAK